MFFFKDVYAKNKSKKTAKFAGYNTEIEPEEDIDDEEYEEAGNRAPKPVDPRQYFDEITQKEPDVNPFEDRRPKTIADRERGTYQERRSKLQLSPGVR